MNTLARLIQRRKAELSLTAKQVADRSQGEISVGLLSKLMSARALDMPRAMSLRGLAVALEIPTVRVVLADAESAGLDVTEPNESSFATKLPANIDQLAPKDRDSSSSSYGGWLRQRTRNSSARLTLASWSLQCWRSGLSSGDGGGIGYPGLRRSGYGEGS